MSDENERKVEDLERRLSSEKESHTYNVFFLILIIGLAVVAFITGGSGWGMLMGGWFVVVLAWFIAKWATSNNRN
jgi:hypothetical protein